MTETETWRYEIQHGPEGEANYAWVYRGKEMVATMRTHHAVAVVAAMSSTPASVSEAAVTDEMVEAGCRAMHEAQGTEDADAPLHSPYQNSWEEPDSVRWKQWDETVRDVLSAETVEADFWAVHSKTGTHIGLWRDKAWADEALREYEGGTMTPLYTRPPARRETWEEAAKVDRPCVEDEIEILCRLASGDTIVFSQDGDMAWFTKGDRAFVGDAIMELRKKSFLLRKCDDDENYRGLSEYDTISEAGRAVLRARATEERDDG